MEPQVKSPSNSLFAAVALAAVLAASFLLPIPVADEDSGRGFVLGIPLCVFKAVTGLPCPFCGLTRSFVCTAHLSLREALQYHPLGPALWALAAVALAYFAARAAGFLPWRGRSAAGTGEAARGVGTGRRIAGIAWIPAAAAVLAVWAMKLLLISRHYW